MKILLDLPDKTVRAIEAIAVQSGQPRAEMLRRAVDSYVTTHAKPLSVYFGIWADNPETADTDKYLSKLRAEWER